jgi:hypothetical protein
MTIISLLFLKPYPRSRTVVGVCAKSSPPSPAVALKTEQERCQGGIFSINQRYNVSFA